MDVLKAWPAFLFEECGAVRWLPEVLIHQLSAKSPMHTSNSGGAQSSAASGFGADDEQNMDLFIGCYRATAYRRIAVMNLMSLSITKYSHNGVIWPSQRRVASTMPIGM
jgi:hypothetical protein